MPADTRGLHQKFVWAHRDGSPVDPDARYFVLRPGKDIHAIAALVAYAESASDDNPVLAASLDAWIAGLRAGAGEPTAYDGVAEN